MQSFACSDHQRELLPFFREATDSPQSKQDTANFEILQQCSWSQIIQGASYGFHSFRYTNLNMQEENTSIWEFARVSLKVLQG